MATEQPATAASTAERFTRWLPWLAVLVGLWAVASPFVLDGSIGSGAAMYSTILAGIAIVVFAAVGAYGVRIRAELPTGTPVEWAGWLAALAGLWLIASPFVLSGDIGSTQPMYSTIGAGVIALVLAAFNGYEHWTSA